MIKRGLTFSVRLYQMLVSPLLPPSCRFVPSCSQYMIDAIREHGAIRGVWLGLRRLLRCQPLCKGGIDFVPERDRGRAQRDPVAWSRVPAERSEQRPDLTCGMAYDL